MDEIGCNGEMIHNVCSTDFLEHKVFKYYKTEVPGSLVPEPEL